MELDWMDIRCPNCNKLLLRIKGLAIIETVCPRCGTKLQWPDLAPLVIAPAKKISPAILLGAQVAPVSGAPVD